MPKRFCNYPGCSVLVERGMCEKHRSRERYCAAPGCNRVVTDGSYCDEHNPRKRHDDKRGNAASRGYDAAWSRVRKSYLAAYPLCELCKQEGRVAAAALVHHVVSIRDGGARLDFNNLQALCVACHGRVHAENNQNPHQ